ncbi:MAG: protein-L-isoaspartate O-methyltransferase family protein [Beijerinckiaceae bacterium]
MSDTTALRRNMIDTQLRTYDVNSPVVLDAVESIERRHFVPEAVREMAYLDRSETLVAGGTRREMLQPMVLARMIQTLEVRRGDRVLDIAGGSGYGAAVMAAIGASVILIEESEALASLAKVALNGQGEKDVTVRVGDLSAGAPDAAPFDLILVEGAVQALPDALLRQLADGGKLAAVEGAGRAGRVIVVTRSGDNFGRRTAFDAAAQMLSSFTVKAEFRF